MCVGACVPHGTCVRSENGVCSSQSFPSMDWQAPLFTFRATLPIFFIMIILSQLSLTLVRIIVQWRSPISSFWLKLMSSKSKKFIQMVGRLSFSLLRSSYLQGSRYPWAAENHNPALFTNSSHQPFHSSLLLLCSTGV